MATDKKSSGGASSSGGSGSGSADKPGSGDKPSTASGAGAKRPVTIDLKAEKVNENTANTKITVSCPTGHRVRGDISMAGNTVRCPRCQTQFVFAPIKPGGSNQKAVTDTGIMRILGDAEGLAPAPDPNPSSNDQRSVTDTGVMRILGDAEGLPPRPEKKTPTHKPCVRCGNSISVNASVCGHCQCYVGVMPQFLEKMFSSKAGSSSS